MLHAIKLASVTIRSKWINMHMTLARLSNEAEDKEYLHGQSWAMVKAWRCQGWGQFQSQRLTNNVKHVQPKPCSRHHNTTIKHKKQHRNQISRLYHSSKQGNSPNSDWTPVLYCLSFVDWANVRISCRRLVWRTVMRDQNIVGILGGTVSADWNDHVGGFWLFSWCWLYRNTFRTNWICYTHKIQQITK